MITLPARAFALLGGFLFVGASLHAQVSLGLDGYSQNFNPNSSGWKNDVGANAWVDNSTLPGWYATTVTTQGTASTGFYRSTNANGASPNFTSNSVNYTISVIAARRLPTDLALGSVSNATTHGVFGVQFVNQTGKTITSLTVSYTGEQWGWNNGGANTLQFAYSTNASSLSSGDWTDYSALSFTALHSGGINRALDGNGNTIFDGNSSYIAKTEAQAGGPDALNYTSISATITGLSIAPGETVWFRWTDVWVGTGTQVGQALAIDDLTVSVGTSPIPEPATAAALLGLAGLSAASLSRRRR